MCEMIDESSESVITTYDFQERKYCVKIFRGVYLFVRTM